MTSICRIQRCRPSQRSRTDRDLESSARPAAREAATRERHRAGRSRSRTERYTEWTWSAGSDSRSSRSPGSKILRCCRVPTATAGGTQLPTGRSCASKDGVASIEMSSPRRSNRALRVGGFGATHVVERTTADPGTSAAALALSVLVVPWRMLTALSADERWMWLVWTWAIAGVELQLRRRRVPRAGIAASPVR